MNNSAVSELEKSLIMREVRVQIPMPAGAAVPFLPAPHSGPPSVQIPMPAGAAVPAASPAATPQADPAQGQTGPREAP